MSRSAMQTAAHALESVECDYLVIGAGPRCMAFTDILLSRIYGKGAVKLLCIIIVDDKDQPGGHWNNTPRFFRLQEDSHRYGVHSRRLERTETKRAAGKGQQPQHASVTEVLAYYTAVIEDFLVTGMVKYFPKSYFTGTVVRSLANPDRAFQVSVKRKLVHGTSIRFPVTPSQERPFKVKRGALVISPSHLSSHAWPTHRYVVIGSGMVGINVVLWLLSLAVDPSKIHWVMPREALLLRKEPMEGPSAAKTTQETAICNLHGTTLQDPLRLSLEAGHVCHIHEDLPPECYHLASVRQEELRQLQRVEQVVRLGHVVCIHPDRMLLEQGQYHTGAGTLYIDCTSPWFKDQPDPEDIFQPGRVILQPVVEAVSGPGVLSTCLSAALTGVIECLGVDDDYGNTLLTGTRLPDTWADWCHMSRVAKGNPSVWQAPETLEFLLTTRLSSYCGKDKAPLNWFSLQKKQSLAQKAELLLARHFQAQAERGLRKGLAPLMLPTSKASPSPGTDLGSYDDKSTVSTITCSPRKAEGVSD